MFQTIKRLAGIVNSPKYVVFHCSDVSYKVSQNQYGSINAYHRDVRQFPKSTLGNWIGYHALITGGKTHKCKEDWEVGAHCNDQGPNGLSMNYQSLGICLGFDGDVEMPTAADAELLAKQIRVWQKTYNIPKNNVKFHRDFSTSGKTCPGSLITRAWIENLLKDPTPSPTPTPIPTPPTQNEAIIKALEALLSLYKQLLAKLRG